MGRLECRCDNCTWAGSTNDVAPFSDFWSRIEAGSVMPVGECPECGCLAYLDTPTAAIADAAQAFAKVAAVLAYGDAKGNALAQAVDLAKAALEVAGITREVAHELKFIEGRAL